MKVLYPPCVILAIFLSLNLTFLNISASQIPSDQRPAGSFASKSTQSLVGSTRDKVVFLPKNSGIATGSPRSASNSSSRPKDSIISTQELLTLQPEKHPSSSQNTSITLGKRKSGADGPDAADKQVELVPCVMQMHMSDWYFILAGFVESEKPESIRRVLQVFKDQNSLSTIDPLSIPIMRAFELRGLEIVELLLKFTFKYSTEQQNRDIAADGLVFAIKTNRPEIFNVLETFLSSIPNAFEAVCHKVINDAVEENDLELLQRSLQVMKPLRNKVIPNIHHILHKALVKKDTRMVSCIKDYIGTESNTRTFVYGNYMIKAVVISDFGALKQSFALLGDCLPRFSPFIGKSVFYAVSKDNIAMYALLHLYASKAEGCFENAHVKAYEICFEKQNFKSLMAISDILTHNYNRHPSQLSQIAGDLMRADYTKLSEYSLKYMPEMSQLYVTPIQKALKLACERNRISFLKKLLEYVAGKHALVSIQIEESILFFLNSENIDGLKCILNSYTDDEASKIAMLKTVLQKAKTKGQSSFEQAVGILNKVDPKLFLEHKVQV